MTMCLLDLILYANDVLAPAVSRYFHILFFDALRYAIPAGLLFLMLNRWFVHWAAPRRLGPAPRGKQISREIRYSMSTVAIFAANGLGIVALADIGLVEIYQPADRYGYVWLLGSLPVIIMLHDIYFYAIHRLLHRPWWFARVHRWHHRSVHPTPWTAYAFHPVEALLMAIFLPMVLLMLPLHSTVIGLFLLLMIIRNVIGHCAVEVAPRGLPGKVYAAFFATTLHHHQHHQYGRGNYGLYFRYMDLLFGTERSDYRAAISKFVTSDVSIAKHILRIWLAALVVTTMSTVDRSALAAQADISHSQAVNGSIPHGSWAIGQWWTPGFSSRVEITRCDEGICGHIVWLWDPGSANIGQPILLNLHFKSNGIEATGSVYNPQDGHTYKATLSQLSPNRLLLRGCILIVCKKQVWIRVEPGLLVPGDRA